MMTRLSDQVKRCKKLAKRLEEPGFPAIIYLWTALLICAADNKSEQKTNWIKLNITWIKLNMAIMQTAPSECYYIPVRMVDWVKHFGYFVLISV